MLGMGLVVDQVSKGCHIDIPLLHRRQFQQQWRFEMVEEVVEDRDLKVWRTEVEPVAVLVVGHIQRIRPLNRTLGLGSHTAAEEVALGFPEVRQRSQL